MMLSELTVWKSIFNEYCLYYETNCMEWNASFTVSVTPITSIIKSIQVFILFMYNHQSITYNDVLRSKHVDIQFYMFS